MSSRALRNGGISCIGVPLGLMVLVVLTMIIVGAWNLNPTTVSLIRVITSLVFIIAIFGLIIGIPIGIALIVSARGKTKQEAEGSQTKSHHI